MIGRRGAGRADAQEIITLTHGAGGKATATLVDSLFLPAFGPAGGPTAPLTDGARLELPSGDALVFTTDSFVVSPPRFSGASIGHLAVNGTVNDLAVMGAAPRWLSVAFVLEEGLPVAELRAIVGDMAAAAAGAGVAIVTGDTKVVERGAADGLYITTAGVGVLPPGRDLDARKVRPGDRVLLSGPIANHGMAVLLARGDLALEADVSSDTAPLHEITEVLLGAAPGTRWLRDPTRGGLATACNELVRGTALGMLLNEEAIPIEPVVAAACDVVGIDPLYVANEGRLVAVVPDAEAAGALAALRAHPSGAGGALIGTVTDDPAGLVVLRTALGGTRVVDLLVGDPLPRIC